MVFGELLRRFLRCVSRLLPLFGLTVSVDNLLIATFGILVAQCQHFLEGVECSLLVIVVTINTAQPFQENCAIVLFFLRVFVICLLRRFQQVL